MKILFIFNGLTHYYNLVLSKLNSEPGLELIVVFPGQSGTNIGEGVYQTRDGINFRVIALEEIRKFNLYTTFKGLAEVLRREQPDAVIVIKSYLRAFLFDVAIYRAMRAIRAGLILKDHPFRMLSYNDALRSIEELPPVFQSLPPFINVWLQKLGVVRRILVAMRRIVHKIPLNIDKLALNLPDAHVNYVEAYEIWESYGINKDKIFITRNSPDTDMLFSVCEELGKTSPSLPHNPHRLIHVGRLVEWKRVDMLLRALKRVRSRFPNAELLVVGMGPQETALRKLSHDLRLDEAVTFTGGVYDPRALGRYYMDSSLYVLAGMGGLSINEAMCFGLPVLCSVCDGTEKMLVREGVNGCYFRDGDEDDLTEKITWMLDHPELLREMGRRSTEIIRDEVNIHTVIDGYVRALHYVSQRNRGKGWQRKLLS